MLRSSTSAQPWATWLYLEIGDLCVQLLVFAEQQVQAAPQPLVALPLHVRAKFSKGDTPSRHRASDQRSNRVRRSHKAARSQTNLCTQLRRAYAVNYECAEAGSAYVRRCLLHRRREPLPEGSCCLLQQAMCSRVCMMATAAVRHMLQHRLGADELFMTPTCWQQRTCITLAGCDQVDAP